MLARNETAEYVADTYGRCDRDRPERNDCYWGTDTSGRENGCLKTGWRGRGCPHWHPVDGDHLDRLLAVLKSWR